MHYKNEWKQIWAQKNFRYKILIGVLLNFAVLILLPAFFQHIEKRNGIQLHDVVLNYVKPINVSLYIFIVMWLMVFLTIVRCIQQPEICITFLFSFFILTISRIITISIVDLNAPQHLIPLVDPITGIFYGQSFITKDLFYSGHVGTQFLMFLCFTKKWDKGLAIVSTICIAILVLLQHIHYVIDVIAAPFFTYACFALGKYVATHNIHFKTNFFL